jgi:uncharacterized protein YqgV (UPF0045/DUF77 family)
MVTCQFSLYPLREPQLGRALEDAFAALRESGLEPEVGTMSSVVEGDEEAVFDGLRQAFRAVASQGDVVLVATVSNACPARVPRSR